MDREKIHIVHIIQRLAMGGLENGLLNLVNHLPSERYSHTIISLTDATEFAKGIQSDAVQVMALNGKGGLDFKMFWQLYRLLKSIEPEIVHSRNMAALETQLVAILARVPIRIHGEHGWDMADLHGTKSSYQWIRKLLFPFLQRIVVLSNHQSDYVQTEYGLNHSKMVRICNGVDTDRFSPNLNIAGGGNKTIIGCVGRLEEVKNHQLLIHAYANVLKQYPSWRDTTELQIVGTGSQLFAINDLISALAISDNVRLLGEQADTAPFYKNWHVYCLPSLAEGISNTLLEAMASGLPVVATAVGGNLDLVSENENGFLVQVDDPQEMTDRLICYLGNVAMREAHSQASRERVLKHFSMETMIDAYAQLYESVLPSAMQYSRI